MTILIAIEQLVKNYPGFSLGPINLELEAGVAVGLVGANGAGKSTLFRCLMGTVRPNQGRITVAGEFAATSQPTWRQRVGYVGDYNPFFDHRSGHWNLALYRRFYDRFSSANAGKLAARLRLDLERKVGAYSTGQRTKLALIAALAHQPDLLLLDEPATGLDPVSREVLLDTLFEYLESGERSLLYATHHIAEIDRLADRLLFMSEGQLVRDEIKEDLLEKWRGLAFRSDKTLPDIPHAQTLRAQPPYRQLISEDYQQSLAFLRNEGIDDIEVSLLSTEQIAVRILRQTMGENHVS